MIGVKAHPACIFPQEFQAIILTFTSACYWEFIWGSGVKQYSNFSLVFMV